MENVASQGNPQLHNQAAIDGWIPFGCLSFRECMCLFFPKNDDSKYLLWKGLQAPVEPIKPNLLLFQICNH